MTKNKYSFSSRFPYAKHFFVLAVLLSIPLTIWSLNNVSTQTQQHAMLPVDGGGSSQLEAPKSLNSSYSNCVKHELSPTFTAKINLSWAKVKNANSYRVTIYNTNSQTIVLNTASTSLTINQYSFQGGYRVYWYVEGYNQSYKIYGAKSDIKQIVFSCNKPLTK